MCWIVSKKCCNRPNTSVDGAKNIFGNVLSPRIINLQFTGEGKVFKSKPGDQPRINLNNAPEVAADTKPGKHFDYSLLDPETGLWTHANKGGPGMEIYIDTHEQIISQKKRLGFDEMYYCVVCEKEAPPKAVGKFLP